MHQPQPQGPPPQYGAPQKKTNPWLWGCLGCAGLVALLVLGVSCVAVVGSGSGDDSGESGSGSGNGGSGEGAGADSDGGQQDDEAVDIGDTVESGAFAFTVSDVETGVKEVGQEFMSEEAQGQYVIVHVTVENVGDESGMFDSSSQTLLDADGKQYDTDSEAEISMEAESFLNEINPGNSVDGRLVFDVPEDVEPARIELRDFLSLDSSAEVKLS